MSFVNGTRDKAALTDAPSSQLPNSVINSLVLGGTRAEAPRPTSQTLRQRWYRKLRKHSAVGLKFHAAKLIRQKLLLHGGGSSKQQQQQQQSRNGVLDKLFSEVPVNNTMYCRAMNRA